MIKNIFITSTHINADNEIYWSAELLDKSHLVGGGSTEKEAILELLENVEVLREFENEEEAKKLKETIIDHLVDDRVILKSVFNKLLNNLQQRDFIKGYALLGVLDEFKDIAKEMGVEL